MLALLLLPLACLTAPSVEPDQAGPFHEGNPLISGISAACDAEAGRWTFRLRTVGWTGGARVYIASGPAQIEQHNLSSDKADRDGAWDCLDLSLAISPDWQEASSGASTRWRCDDAPALSFALVAYDPHGDHVSDCRVWGADPTVWASVEGGPACDIVLDTDTGAGTDTGADTDTEGEWPGDVDACGG